MNVDRAAGRIAGDDAHRPRQWPLRAASMTCTVKGAHFCTLATKPLFPKVSKPKAPCALAAPQATLFGFLLVAPHSPECFGACIVCGRLHLQLQFNYACATR